MNEKLEVILVGYRKNNVIMGFVRGEALEKVSSELNAEGICVTAKGVDLMIQMPRYRIIKDRVESYAHAGLVGCLIASLKPRKARNIFDKNK